MGGRLWLTACMLYIGIAWGLVPSLAKLVSVEGASVLNATFAQALAGGALLLLLTVARGRTFYLTWHHLWFYVVCGFTGTTIPTAVIFAVSAKVGAGMVSIMIALAPILTYFGALLMGLEPRNRWRLTGVALGFCSVILLIVPDLEIGPDTLTAWLFLTLAIPVCYAAETLIIAVRRPPKGDAMMLVAGMLLSSAVVMLPAVLWTGTLDLDPSGWDAVSTAIAAIALINVTAYVVYLYVISAAGPVFATFAGYLNMVAGVLWGIALWHEDHTLWVWGAAALLAVAMYLVRERPAGRT